MTVIYSGSPLRDQWVRNAHTHTLVDTHTHPAGWFLIPYCHYGEGITAPPAVWLVICVHVWDDDVLCACFVLNRWTKTSCHLEWWIPERFPEDLISHLPLQILAGRWPEDEALRWVTHVYVHLKAATATRKVTHVFHFYFLSRNNLSLCLIDNVLLLSGCKNEVDSTHLSQSSITSRG